MVNATVHDRTVACGTKSRNRIMSTGVAYGALGVAGHPNRAALGEARAGSRSSGSCPVSRPDRPGLGPHHLNKVWPFPKAHNHGRDVTDSRHLAHADLSACSPHRVKVLPDVAQRSDSVPPRAHEDKPAAIEAPEVWPLELSPCFFKPWKRPPSFYVPLSHCRNPPQTSCDIATGVKCSPA